MPIIYIPSIKLDTELFVFDGYVSLENAKTRLLNEIGEMAEKLRSIPSIERKERFITQISEWLFDNFELNTTHVSVMWAENRIYVNKFYDPISEDQIGIN